MATSPIKLDWMIITALEKEAKAVVSRLEGYNVSRFEAQDIRTYHCGTVPIEGRNLSYRVAVTLLPSVGEIPAANAVTDAIVRWNPRFVLLVGIAGGFPQDDLDLGDVVIGDQIVGYDYGKITKGGIEPRDRVYPASPLLLERVRSFWDHNWAQQVNVPRPGNARRTASKLFFGPIASGNRVIATAAFRRRLAARWSKLIAVEMEAEGVLAAVFDRPEIRGTLVIRGICDMADERKGDEWQEYAANAAAAFVIGFLKSGPVDPVMTETVSPGIPRVSLARLPSTSPDLFGRRDELAALHRAWSSPETNVLSLVAWGGAGKTALVNKWLSEISHTGYCGAERVYGWSFYSQGAAEGQQVSADPFIAAALKWFGDPDPMNGSPWEKGERLAELVRQVRTLLIIDGLEPLQSPPPVAAGRIKDPGLCCLLRELARQNLGLCIITTRLEVDDLKDCVGSTVEQIDLEDLAKGAGAEYLAHLGVKGPRGELEQAVADFGGHALTLTLLGSYLRAVYGGDVRQRDRITRLSDEMGQGAHVRGVLKSYERWLEGKPELDILQLMGLFDRPAESGAIAAVMAPPAILNLTSSLQGLSHIDWQYAVEHLRAMRLLCAPESDEPDTLDCHPLLREHFADKLRMGNPEAWREANRRLYEYEKSIAKDHPDTIEEMAPLYAAVGHGCQAGLHAEVLDEVYWPRIQRGASEQLQDSGEVSFSSNSPYFNVKRLGAISADLAILASFFESPWDKPVLGLSAVKRGFILNEVGFDLRALGRLTESDRPMRAALNTRIAHEDWSNAAEDANNLGELHSALGNLAQAVEYARQSVELADRSSNAFLRMAMRTTLADALHQMGHDAEAETIFIEAEVIQKARPRAIPLLFSVWGFRYCDFLLDHGKYHKVQERMRELLRWRQPSDSLLEIALEELSSGRAYLLQAECERTGDYYQAAKHLDCAVSGLRQAGERIYIVRGLVIRAALGRVTGALESAQRDLDEGLSAASRGGVRLYLADCLLEHARLCLARGERDRARESAEKSSKMIEEIGYHRLDENMKQLLALL